MKKLFVLIVIALAFTALLPASSLRETRVTLGASQVLGLSFDSGYFTDGILFSTDAVFDVKEISFAAEASATTAKGLQVFDTALFIMRDATINNKVTLLLQAGPTFRFIADRGLEVGLKCQGGMRYDLVKSFELTALAGVRVSLDGMLGVDLKLGVSYRFEKD